MEEAASETSQVLTGQPALSVHSMAQESSMQQSLRSSFTTVWDTFFLPLDGNQQRVLRWIFLAFLYLAGVFLWGKLFGWGRAPLDFSDWALINIPRIDFVREALRMGVLPLHMADTSSLHDISDRYFTLPDVVTTPQMLLLLFVSVGRYVFFDIILHYSISFLGLLWFYKRYSLSLFTFTILFLLFEFNGYIFSHYSVGHFTWAGYFLFPIFFSLIIRFLDGEEGWVWVASMSFLLFYMVLTGSQHHFVWLLLFLGAMIVTYWRRAKWIVLVILFSGLLSAVRLLPPVLQLADYQNKAIFTDVFGYPSLAHLVSGMVLIQLPMESPLIYYPLNSYVENFWEFNFYLGIIGFIFVIYFGLFQWLKGTPPRWKELILLVFVLIALSIGSTYWIVRLTRIPLFASERAAMRMILVGCITFQEWWNNKKLEMSHEIVALMTLGLMFIDLWSNLKAWRPSEIRQYFTPVPINVTGNLVANHADPQYFLVLGIGLFVTLITAIFLIAMSWRETRLKRKTI